MSQIKKAAIAMAVTVCVMSMAVMAQEMKNGTLMMVMPDGKMTTMPMPDKSMMDSMMQHAEEMKEGMVVLVWGQKLYVIKNEKMPNGQMTFDYWGLHGAR